MEQLILFVKDVLTRLQSKSPRFFNILKWISATIATLCLFALWVNSQWGYGWENVMVFVRIPLTDLFKYLALFLTGIFSASALTMSTGSKNREKLLIEDSKTDKPDDAA